MQRLAELSISRLLARASLGGCPARRSKITSQHRLGDEQPPLTAQWVDQFIDSPIGLLDFRSVSCGFRSASFRASATSRNRDRQGSAWPRARLAGASAPWRRQRHSWTPRRPVSSRGEDGQEGHHFVVAVARLPECQVERLHTIGRIGLHIDLLPRPFSMPYSNSACINSGGRVPLREAISSIDWAVLATLKPPAWSLADRLSALSSSKGAISVNGARSKV